MCIFNFRYMLNLISTTTLTCEWKESIAAGKMTLGKHREGVRMTRLAAVCVLGGLWGGDGGMFELEDCSCSYFANNMNNWFKSALLPVIFRHIVFKIISLSQDYVASCC